MLPLLGVFGLSGNKTHTSKAIKDSILKHGQLQPNNLGTHTHTSVYVRSDNSYKEFSQKNFCPLVS